MKILSKAISIITLTAFMGAITGCPVEIAPPVTPPDKPDAVILDMRNVTMDDFENWEGWGDGKQLEILEKYDFYLVGEGIPAMLYSVNEDTGYPTEVYTKPFKDYEGYEDVDLAMSFDDEGRPSGMVINDHIFYFSNYDGYRFDLAVEYPDGEVECHFGVETDTNWDTFAEDILSSVSSGPNLLVSAARSASRASFGEIAGGISDIGFALIDAGLAITSCAVLFYFPLMLPGCIINIVAGIVNFSLWLLEDALGPDWATWLGISSDVVSTITDAIGCMAALSAPTPLALLEMLDCISVVATLASTMVTLVKYGLDKLKEYMTPPAPEMVKVNYHANNGSKGQNASIPFEVEKGSHVTLPVQGTLSNGLQPFKGWGTDPSSKNAYGAGTVYPYEISKNTSFYAIWYDAVDVTATLAGTDSVRVNWGKPEYAVTYYEVWRSEQNPAPGKNGQRINETKVKSGISPTTTTFTDTGLSAGTTYYYKIKALRNGPTSEVGESFAVKIPEINYSALPNNANNTTAINFVFSSAVSGLSASDIVISNIGSGENPGSVTKGALTGSGKNWSLAVTVATAGNITLSINKHGIEKGNRYITVGKAATTPGATSYTATANDAANTTAINLAFSAAVSGLTANDITVTNGTGSVTKGALTGSGKDWSLAVTVATAGTVTVKITKSGIESATKTVTVGKGTSVVPLEGMVWVPGGSFEMGGDPVGYDDERPVHTVTLTGFYMGKYEVTQKQWLDIMGSLPSNLPSSSYGVGDNYPVYYVNWYDALVFCNTLSIQEGLTPAYRINYSTDPAAWGTVPTSSSATWNAAVIVSGSTGYRLPTEAQWEYAAKGGNGSPGNYIYAGSNNPDDVAWYNYNGGSTSKEVGTKAPNGLGLYDMSGNVYEWCWDWYGSYSSGAQTDPVGASSGSYRVRRGGDWYRSDNNARSTCRGYSYTYDRRDSSGFRLVRPAQ